MLLSEPETRPMFYTTNYLNQSRISLYGLHPDTPESDYEIHLIRATDPTYIPPDSELWPLYFTKVFEIVQRHPAVRDEISAAIHPLCEKVKGLRALRRPGAEPTQSSVSQVSRPVAHGRPGNNRPPGRSTRSHIKQKRATPSLRGSAPSRCSPNRPNRR